jgi:hypothetical protein
MLRREAGGFSLLRVACDLPTMGVVLETLCFLFGSASLGWGGDGGVGGDWALRRVCLSSWGMEWGFVLRVLVAVVEPFICSRRANCSDL